MEQEISLAEKQRTERDVYNAHVHRTWDGKSLAVDPNTPPFATYNGDLFDAAKKYFGDVAGKRVLEIGCGNGELSVWFAKNGANVTGIDISDESIRVAQQRAKDNGLADQIQFMARAGEEPGFPDNTFDIVFIAVALHHLDVEIALKEIHRVLKPGGWFVAIEPFVFSDTVQAIRSSKIIQKLYPERRETPTERILYNADLDLIRQHFTQLEYRPYRVFSPFIFKLKLLFNALSNLFQKSEHDPEIRRQKMNRALQRGDERLLHNFPMMKIFSRYVVFRAQPKK